MCEPLLSYLLCLVSSLLPYLSHLVTSLLLYPLYLVTTFLKVFVSAPKCRDTVLDA